MTKSQFDITPFLDQDEGQHFDRRAVRKTDTGEFGADIGEFGADAGELSADTGEFGADTGEFGAAKPHRVGAAARRGRY